MNKFMLAYVAFVAIAVSCVVAKPNSYGANAAWGAGPAALVATGPASVSIVGHPVSALRSAINAPLAGYGAPSASYNDHLQPIAVNGYNNGRHGAAAAPSPLIAASSNPVARSSANTAIAGLAPGRYTQIAIPSYEILTGNVLNPAGGHANIVGGYGGPANGGIAVGGLGAAY